jgi:hypothetical protein
MEKKYIWIQGDTNDAGYAERFEEYEETEQSKKLIDFLVSIKGDFNISEWCNEDDSAYKYVEKENITEDEYEFLIGLLPHDIHTVVHIRICTVSNEEALL